MKKTIILILLLLLTLLLFFLIRYKGKREIVLPWQAIYKRIWYKKIKNGTNIILPSPTNIQSINPTTTTYIPTTSTKLSNNPFGVMIGGSNIDNETKIDLAKSLGVSYFRPSDVKVHNDNWVCKDCEAISRAGLKLVLTVRNGGGLGNPSTPPTDINVYKERIGRVLDKYKPALLVVENEENSQELFYSGTPVQYHQELAAACNIAHQKGIKCTNGGLVSALVALLVADSYKQQGDNAKADNYLKRTLDANDYDKYQKNPNSQKIVDLISRGRELLAGYKNSGADFVNFHWYIKDSEALSEAVNYLKNTTGLPVVTNEIGQQENEDPQQVTSIMSMVVKLDLPIAVWFSMDVSGYAQARALQNPDFTLRPNGVAFKNFIEKNY